MRSLRGARTYRSTTATAVTDTLQLPARPPSVAILIHAATTSSTRSDRCTRGVRSQHHPTSRCPTRTSRFIDGTHVGRGRDISVDSPATGRHEVRLQVTVDDYAAADTTRSSVSPPSAGDEGPAVASAL